MSMGEETNYKKFLGVILSSKVLESLPQTGDSLLLKKAMDIIDDKKDLILIYNKSKTGNQLFTDYFKSYINFDKKIN
jgi:hypothetical protein